MLLLAVAPTGLAFVILILAAICFGCAAIGWPNAGRFNLIAAGLLLCLLVYMFG